MHLFVLSLGFVASSVELQTAACFWPSIQENSDIRTLKCNFGEHVQQEWKVDRQCSFFYFASIRDILTFLLRPNPREFCQSGIEVYQFHYHMRLASPLCHVGMAHDKWNVQIRVQRGMLAWGHEQK